MKSSLRFFLAAHSADKVRNRPAIIRGHFLGSNRPAEFNGDNENVRNGGPIEGRKRPCENRTFGTEISSIEAPAPLRGCQEAVMLTATPTWFDGFVELHAEDTYTPALL